MKTYWGIDLGGTKVEAVVLEQLYPLKVVHRQRIPTESQLGYEHILHRIGLLVEQVAEAVGHRPEHIGFGTPGILDPGTGRMKNCNTTALNGQALKDDLERQLNVEATLANDANCFALAEATMGAVPEQVPDAQVVFGIILGTGVGGGVVINGKVLEGKHGIGGEWGHNFLHESGGPCYCGLSGCVETVLSGPALEGYYQQLSGVGRNLPEIVARHAKGEDAHASETVARLLRHFGQGMANVLNLIDADAVVIGGGVGNIELLYTEGVRWVKHFVFHDQLETRFLKPLLGDSAGVFGAASLLA